MAFGDRSFSVIRLTPEAGRKEPAKRKGREMNAQETPGRRGYGLAAALLILGIIAFVACFGMLARAGDGLTQVIAPGETELSLDETGKYTIFYESESVVGDEIVSTGEMPPMNIGVFSKESGEPADVSESSTETTYTFGGRSGESIAQFTVDAPGDYVVRSEYPNGEDLGSIVLAVGKGVTGNIFGAILLGFAGAGLTLGAFISALVTFLRRRRAKREVAPVPGPIQPTI